MYGQDPSISGFISEDDGLDTQPIDTYFDLEGGWNPDTFYTVDPQGLDIGGLDEYQLANSEAYLSVDTSGHLFDAGDLGMST